MLEWIMIAVNALCGVTLTIPVLTDRYLVPVPGEGGAEYRLKKVNAFVRLAEGCPLLYIGLALFVAGIIVSVFSLLKKSMTLKILSIVLTVLSVALTVVLMLIAAARQVKY